MGCASSSARAPVDAQPTAAQSNVKEPQGDGGALVPEKPSQPPEASPNAIPAQPAQNQWRADDGPQEATLQSRGKAGDPFYGEHGEVADVPLVLTDADGYGATSHGRARSASQPPQRDASSSPQAAPGQREYDVLKELRTTAPEGAMSAYAHNGPPRNTREIAGAESIEKQSTWTRLEARFLVDGGNFDEGGRVSFEDSFSLSPGLGNNKGNLAAEDVLIMDDIEGDLFQYQEQESFKAQSKGTYVRRNTSGPVRGGWADGELAQHGQILASQGHADHRGGVLEYVEEDTLGREEDNDVFVVHDSHEDIAIDDVDMLFEEELGAANAGINKELQAQIDACDVPDDVSSVDMFAL